MSDNLRGILWMMMGVSAFAFIPLCLRYVKDDLSIYEILFLRAVIAFLIVVPWNLRMPIKRLITPRIWLYLLRAGLTFAAMYAWYYGLIHMLMADAVALQFTAPLFTTMLAIMLLGEKVDAKRWGATLLGFTGAVVILRPGIEVVSLAALAVLASAILFSGASICAKILTRTEPASVILFYFYLLLIPFPAIPSLLDWTPPSFANWGWLAGLAIANILGHLGMVRAFTLAETSVVVPFDFLRLILVALIGFAVFAEMPDAWTWTGAAIIFISTYYLARQETMRARKPEPEAETR